MPRSLFALGVLIAAFTATAARGDSEKVYPGCDAVLDHHRAPQIADPQSLQRILSAAHGGDVIQLSGGDYGAVALIGDHGGFVTVTRQPGAAPRLSALSVSGGHWVVSGLAVVGFSKPAISWNGWQGHDPLVKIENARDVVLTDNLVASTEGEASWGPETRGVTDAQALSDGVSVLDSRCVAVSHNQVKNIFNGVVIGINKTRGTAERFLVLDNTIDDFAGDGVDHTVSDLIIRSNRITDAHNICDNQCIHMDGIQGWNSGDRDHLESRNIVIDGNTIIRVARPNLPRPATALQGITIFDGNWSNLTVSNNIVVVNAWHGITLFGPKDTFVVNNTVANDFDRKGWIMIAKQKDNWGGREPQNVVVQNNLAMDYKFAPDFWGNPAGVKAANNYTLDDPGGMFRAFDVKKGQFDLHLRHPRGGFEAGVRSPQADHDIDGRKRAERTELGAYGSSAPAQP